MIDCERPKCECDFKKTWRIIENVNYSLKQYFMICKAINWPVYK